MKDMEFKGTKGEWDVKHSQSKTAYNVVGTALGEKYKIARCPYDIDKRFSNSINETEKKECESNAQLISAAPELLNALIRLKAMYTDLESTLYGQNMTVNNWHLNGDTEPIDKFFEDLDLDAIEHADSIIAKALGKDASNE